MVAAGTCCLQVSGGPRPVAPGPGRAARLPAVAHSLRPAAVAPVVQSLRAAADVPAPQRRADVTGARRLHVIAARERRLDADVGRRQRDGRRQHRASRVFDVQLRRAGPVTHDAAVDAAPVAAAAAHQVDAGRGRLDGPHHARVGPTGQQLVVAVYERRQHQPPQYGRQQRKLNDAN